MPTIVKLLVLGPEEERIGTLVLDLESLFSLYRAQVHFRLQAQAQAQSQPSSGPEVPDSAREPVGEYLDWVQDDDGQIHLQPKPWQPPTTEE